MHDAERDLGQFFSDSCSDAVEDSRERELRVERMPTSEVVEHLLCLEEGRVPFYVSLYFLSLRPAFAWARGAPRCALAIRHIVLVIVIVVLAGCIAIIMIGSRGGLVRVRPAPLVGLFLGRV